MAYDNPRHRKEQPIKTLVNYYDAQEFRDYAQSLRMSPSELNRRLIQECLASMRAERQQERKQA